MKFIWSILEILTSLLFTLLLKTALGEECSMVFKIDNKTCTHAHEGNKSMSWRTKNICTNLTEQQNPLCSSSNSSMCGKDLRISVYDQQLFSIVMKNTFRIVMSQCCAGCGRCTVVNEVGDTMQYNADILKSSDVIFPVIGSSYVNKIHGYHFLPVYGIPSSFYFSIKKSNSKILAEVFLSCLNLWPFVLVCCFFAFVSGFIVWLIESKSNHKDFSKHFPAGLFDGFWWSFVAMTTVGFGDKVPRSYVGRTFAVMWVLIGIALCSLFTATLTTKVILAHAPSNPDITGKQVAVLKGRLHDMEAVAHYGGMVRIGSIFHTMLGIDEMIDMIENKTVTGFLIDKNTGHHFTSRIKESKYQHIETKMKRIGLIRMGKDVEDHRFSCGFMIREREDYELFKSYIDNNNLALHSCNLARMNVRESMQDPGNYMFDPNGSLLLSVLCYCVLVFLVIVCAGMLMEARKHFFQQHDDDRTLFRFEVSR